MQESKSGVALPVLVALVGVMLCVSGWLYLIRERRSQIDEIAADVAAQSRRTVAATVHESVSALRNLSGFWAAVGRRPVEEWRADAELLIESYPEIDYIAWVYPDGRSARVAAGRYETAAVHVEPEEAKRLGRTPRLLGPELDEAGETMLRVLLPVQSGGQDLGILEAKLRISPLLSRALAESAPGYAIRVFWNEQPIFARGEPTQDPWQAWWREEGEILLPLATIWTAEHAPTPELADTLLDPIPHYLLAVGCLLALVLGVLTHQLRLSRVRAHRLAAGNEALSQSEDELRRLNETLEMRVAERTQELEAFTHSISHDLKSPLGAIQNFAAILELDYRDRALDDEGHEIVERIQRSAARGTDLLEGLLRLSRAGHADLRIENIDMNRLAAESFALARKPERDADVMFVQDPLPDAAGDRALVADVLVNLFDNSLKYSEGKEKPRIIIRGRVSGGESIYEIEDNGQGFDMRFSEKLFGLFQRLPSSHQIEGTGVGLALVSRVVRRHDGRVWAEGRPGAGATFSFSLPAGRTAHE